MNKINKFLAVLLLAILVYDTCYLAWRWRGMCDELIEAQDQVAELQAEIVALQQEKAELEVRLAATQDENEALREELMVAMEMLSDVNALFGNDPIELTPQEELELKTAAQAEAESEGIIGKALVMRVILNRVQDDNYPNNIHDVIFSGAFNVTEEGGRYYTVTPDMECDIALLMVAAGWDGSRGAKWFCAGGYPAYGEPVLKFRNHYFSA